MSPLTPAQCSQSIKAEAARLGFGDAGICPAISPAGFSRLEIWVDRGFAGEMSYFERRKSAYRHPAGVMKNARSLVMLLTPYQTAESSAPATGEGRVSRYAWSDGDYHDILFERTSRLGHHLQSLVPDSEYRAVVDTAPLLERDFAALAGLGWQAKNTLLIHKSLGSWCFLSALLTDAELECDPSFAADHCGTCTACLDACPTDAFVEPNLLDATRCISYLTIEHRSPIPRELRVPMGDWVFGCDVCQDVCPWNRKPTPTLDPQFAAVESRRALSLTDLFSLDDASFRARFRETPLWRPRRRGLLRNAAIALGNGGDVNSIGALQKGLNDDEGLVRGAAAWALGRIGGEDACRALRARMGSESDPEVRDEIAAALGNC